MPRWFAGLDRWPMVAAANQLMTNTMTGLRSGEASAGLAGRRLPSCPYFLRLTRITGCPSEALRRYFVEGLFRGNGGTACEGSPTRGGPCHAPAMVPQPGFFAAAVFVFGARGCLPSVLGSAGPRSLGMLPLRWHSVSPFLACFWPLRL